jgi:hypothetical protein
MAGNLLVGRIGGVAEQRQAEHRRSMERARA